MQLPDRVGFIGIGARKSATTWLYENLVAHPQIATPGVSKKEVDYFSTHHARGDAWYHSHFDSSGPLVGEFSVSYFADPQVPCRVHRYNPQMRMILSLRNPVDRLLSEHLFEIQRGRTKADVDFWQAFEESPLYVNQGMYATHLQRWLEYFDLKNLHIVLFDDIQTAPKDVLTSTLTFLGADPTLQRRTLPPKNVATTYRSGRFRKVTHRLGRQTLRHLGPTPFRILQRTGLPRLAHRLNERPADKSAVNIDVDDRKRLAEFFVDEIETLGSLIGRDLSSWLDMPKAVR